MTKIDNITHHDTPEGTTLALMPAGIVPRLGAWLVDMAVRAIIMIFMYFALIFLGESGMGILLIIYFLVEWFYPVLFEVYRDGQTIGKKQFGIQVCQDDGMSVTWRTSMIRNLLRVADFLPMFFISALLCMLFQRQSKRLGDLVAGTMVVYVYADKTSFDIPMRQARTPSIPLLFDEQQAILAFAERLDELPRQRQDELAGILTSLTAQKNLAKSSDELVGFANAIIGREQL